MEALHWGSAAAASLGELRAEEWPHVWLALIPFAERVGNLYVLSNACRNVGVAYRNEHGNFTHAAMYLEQAVDVAQRRGGVSVILNAQADRMTLDYFTGEWDRAEERGRQACALRGEKSNVEPPWGWYAILLALGTLDLARGRSQLAEDHLGEAISFGDTLVDPNLDTRRYAQRLLAERDLLIGEATAAHARLQPLLDRPGMQEWEVPSLLPILAWAQLALDRDDEAAATLAEANARCGKLWRVDALRVDALLAIKQQRWEDAAASLDEALALCRAMPYPYAKAKALYVYGQLFAATGEPERAREKYQQALAICERLGEGLYRPHIERAFLP